MPDTKQVGVNWELANADAVDWARRHSSRFMDDFDTVTRDKIRRSVAGYVEGGENLGQLRDRIATTGAFNPERAKLIARTEVTAAYAEGNLTAWKESDVVEGKEWNTRNDEIVCSICGPLDGTTVPLNGEFEGAGHSPPAHAGCRCWVTPVVMDDLRTGAEIFEAYGLEREPGIGAPSVPTAAPTRLQPDGVPVTDNLGVIGDDARREFGDESLRAIDEVHGDGDLPRLRAYQDELAGNINGSYKQKRNMDTDSATFLEIKPDRIVVNPDGTHKHMTFVHETGHFIDDVGIPGKGFSSNVSDLMDDWRDTVHQTDAYKEMQGALSGESTTTWTSQIGGKSYTAKPGDKFLNYALSDHEVFARSYSQYIAERSSSTLLKAELDSAISSQMVPLQWATDDFASVGSAFDRLFQGLGWLK